MDNVYLNKLPLICGKTIYGGEGLMYSLFFELVYAGTHQSFFRHINNHCKPHYIMGLVDAKRTRSGTKEII